MKYTILLSFFITSFTLFFMAHAKGQTHMQVDCTKANTQYEMNECALRQTSKAEQELNNDYKHIKELIKKDPQKEENFTKAQRAWLDFIKQECTFQSEDLGSARSTVYAQCREALIEKRVADFRYYLTCAEGDLACPTKR